MERKEAAKPFDLANGDTLLIAGTQGGALVYIIFRRRGQQVLSCTTWYSDGFHTTSLPPAAFPSSFS